MTWNTYDTAWYRKMRRDTVLARPGMARATMTWHGPSRGRTVQGFEHWRTYKTYNTSVHNQQFWVQPFHLMTLPPSLQETQERLYAEIKPSVEVEIECNIELHTRVCNVSSRKVCFGKNIRNLASDLLTCSQLERCFLKKPFQELGTIFLWHESSGMSFLQTLVF